MREGKIEKHHDWIGSSWAILFSNAADCTPVSSIELARVVNLEHEFNICDVNLMEPPGQATQEKKRRNDDATYVKLIA